jgi:hypothetical protein
VTAFGREGEPPLSEQCLAFANGQRSFDFDPKIYGDTRVKSALVKAQRGKCCFCESTVGHIAYGHVEHFRPKGGFRQKASGKLEKLCAMCCRVCGFRRHAPYSPNGCCQSIGPTA